MSRIENAQMPKAQNGAGLPAVPLTKGLQATGHRALSQLQIPQTSSAGVQPLRPAGGLNGSAPSKPQP